LLVALRKTRRPARMLDGPAGQVGAMGRAEIHDSKMVALMLRVAGGRDVEQVGLAEAVAFQGPAEPMAHRPCSDRYLVPIMGTATSYSLLR
jgi:hypothetical protein